MLEREGDLIRVEQVEPVDRRPQPQAVRRRRAASGSSPRSSTCTRRRPTSCSRASRSRRRYVVFLLVTDRLERVLPTIVSRCQVVEFRPLSDAEVARVPARARHGLDGGAAEALARLSRGSVERAARLADDARGAAPPRASTSSTPRALAGRRAAAPTAPSRRRPSSACSSAQQARDRATRSQADLDARLAELERAVPGQERPQAGTQDRPRRAPSARRRAAARLAAQDALDLLVSWVRDLWVVACGASDVLWNSDHADELAEAVVATPEYYARLLAVAARTRKDLYLNIDQKLALQAMFARFEEVATSA